MEIWRQVATASFIVGVIGNLCASIIWAVPALIHLHRKLDRHHQEHLQILASHGIIKGESGGEKDAVRD